MKPLSLQGCIVPHLKDLTHICLEPEAHSVLRLLMYFFFHQSDPSLLHNWLKSRFNLQGTVHSKAPVQLQDIPVILQVNPVQLQPRPLN